MQVHEFPGKEAGFPQPMTITTSDTAPEGAEPEAPSDYVATVSFEDLHLSEELRRGIADCGYTAPTPVQASAIPKVLAGTDLIVRSKTVTGKTANCS